MRIHNVHTRELPAPADRIGPLLDRLGSDNDRLWPTERWPTIPMRFDRPLQVGASGGHGVIRYDVVEYEPGRRVVFRFPPGSGFDGIHKLELEPLAGGCCRLTHTLDVKPGVKMLPLVPVILSAHDVVVEDLLDNAERAAGGTPPPPQPIPRAVLALDKLESMLLSLAKPVRRGVASPK